jgi:hypothetical protein
MIALRRAREAPGNFSDLAAVLAIQPSAVASKRLFDGMDCYSGTDMEEQSCYGDNG